MPRLSFLPALPLLALTLLFPAPPAMAQPAGSFTLAQALSAPFSSSLSAAPAANRAAWLTNAEGRRNLWLSEPKAGKTTARQLTHFTADDGIDIGDITWSADGNQLAFARGGDFEYPSKPPANPALLPGGVEEQIWVADLTSTADPRPLTPGQSPIFTHSGDALFYLLHDQIWSISLKPAAKPDQLLHTRGNLSDLALSPDGKWLSFVSHRGDHSLIGVYNLAAKSLTYLQPSADQDNYPAWSPDSTRIAWVRLASDPDEQEFAQHRTTDLPFSLWVGEVATGKCKQIWWAETGPGSVFHEFEATAQLLWTAGNRILFPWEMDGWLHIWSAPATGGAAKLLTPGNYEAEDLSLSPDRRTLFFSSNQSDSSATDLDRRHLYQVALDENGLALTKPTPITSGDGLEFTPIQLSDGHTLLALHSDTRLAIRPAEVTVTALTDLAPAATPADYPAARFVTPQQVIFPAADGLSIHGQLFLPPPGSDSARHPALVFFHGGSRRQMLLGYHYMDYYSNAYAMNQYLASLGYVVLAANYRSGIGYGKDFREALNYGAGGASEFNDVLGAGLYLRSRPDVDPARIGSWGGSYGGYLTALALARASSLFAAGVDLHGVHDWNIELGRWNTPYKPLADPNRARIAYESSPIASVSTWRSPVLLIHGDDDRNVQFTQTPEIAAALRKQGTPVEELIFPDEIHGFLLHRDWLAAYSATADFFSRKLAPK